MSTDLAEVSKMCADANRIAAQLRAGQPLTKRVNLQTVAKTRRAVRAYATGVSGKGGYLRQHAASMQAQVLDYCRDFFARNDQIPPQASIAAHFGVDEQVAQKYMRRLGDAGDLERNEVGKWRFARARA